MRHRRTVLVLAVLAALASAMPFVAARPRPTKGKASRGKVLPEVVAASVAESSAAPAMPPTGFAPQSRRGFTMGDQWEPAIAADGYGTVYVLYPQYLGVPGCPDCPSPTMGLQVSRDRGVPLVLLAAILVLLGLLPALYTSRRKIWVRAEPNGNGTVLKVGGFALQRKPQFDEEFSKLVDAMARAAGGDSSVEEKERVSSA